MGLKPMGLVYASIELIRGADIILVQEGFIQENQIRRVAVSALIDSGATMLTIPRFIRDQLELRKVGELEAELADGSRCASRNAGLLSRRWWARFQWRRWMC